MCKIDSASPPRRDDEVMDDSRNVPIRPHGTRSNKADERPVPKKTRIIDICSTSTDYSSSARGMQAGNRNMRECSFTTFLRIKN